MRTLIITIFITLATVASAQSEYKDSIFRSLSLDSVVITAQRPLVKSEGSRQTIMVKGSYLSRMGTLGNMLAFTPGMAMTTPGNYTVVGKGVPKYYVDGREVTVQDIFNIIKSDNIARIEIEREPSAKYPSGTNAVVNIVTIKPISDFISLDASATLQIRRKISANPGLGVKMKKGIWSGSLNYMYGAFNNLNKETYYTEIFSEDTHERRFRSDVANDNYSARFSHTVSWNNDLNISDNHRIGFAYYFEHALNKTVDGESVTYTGLRHYADKDMSINTRLHRNMHNFTLSYQGRPTGKSLINVSADYSLITQNGTTGSYETNKESGVQTDIFTWNDNKYNVLTLNATYSMLLPLKIAADIGARYYNVASTSDHDTDNPRFTAYYASNRQKTRDNVSAAYIALTRKWGRLFTQVSARYEYSDTRMTVFTSDGVYTSRRHTSDLLPSAVVSYRLNDDWNFQLSYSRSVQRPGYLGMNPYPTYQDSLTYSVGNIDIRPSVIDRFAAYISWRSLTAAFGYRHSRDVIDNVMYCMDGESDVVSNMPVNFGRSESWFVTLYYNKAFGRLNFNGSVSVNFPRDKYVFLGRVYRADKANCDGSFNLSYPLAKNIYAFTSYSFQSWVMRMNTYQRPASNWTLGLQAALLKNRLTLMLSYTDILHDANYNNSYVSYVNTRHGTYGTNDMRGVMLSASLKLFNRDIKVKTTRNNNDAINRTY